MTNTTKPSGTNSTKPLDSLTFFTDQDTSCEVLIGELISAGATVVKLRDMYDPDAPDEKWLEEVSQKKWLILSRNKRIRYVKSQLDKIIKYNGRAFFVTSPKNLTGDQMAERIRICIPGIAAAAKADEGPFIMKLSSLGVVGWYGRNKGEIIR